MPSWLGSIVELQVTESYLTSGMMTACSSLRHLTVDTNCCFGSIPTPSLTSLVLSFENDEVEEGDTALADLLENFTYTPALTNLTAQSVHGNQIPALFDPMALPQLHLPALTSLVFAGRFSECSSCHDDPSPRYTPDTISSLPLQTFPSLSSFALIDICHAAKIIGDILGIPSSLRTVTIGTEQRLLDVEDLYEALKGAVSAARQENREVPTMRLSPSLFYLPYWQENDVDVELFEGMEKLRS
jgi:hypothetical protein